MVQPSSSIEVERKYEVSEHMTQPDLAGISCVRGVAPLRHDDLDAVYFDTDDCVLLAHRVTLRRRSGGVDEGWHVKLPAAEGRQELHWPLSLPRDSAGIPAMVREAVARWTGERRLDPVARIRTHRTTRSLLGSDGRVVAEVVQDKVRAVDCRTLREQAWHEWEVELGTAAPATRSWHTRLLNEIEHRLVTAGAYRSQRPSKLGTVLDIAAPRASASAISLVLERLTDELAGLLPAAASDRPDSIHQARIRIRRIRSVLAAFPGLFSAKESRRLRARLRELGFALAEARDLEVLAGRAAGDLLDGAPQSRHEVIERIGTRRRSALDGLSAVLAGSETGELLAQLRRLASSPHSTPVALAPADPALPLAVGGLADQVSACVARALRDFATQSADDIHTMRKRARRLRYAAEAILPYLGDETATPVAALESAAHDLQDVVGEYRDDVIFAEHLADGRIPELTECLDNSIRLDLIDRASTRAEETLSGLPRTLEALDRARGALATALFGRSR